MDCKTITIHEETVEELKNSQKQKSVNKNERSIKIYLVSYNLFQFIGFFYIYGAIIIRYVCDRYDSFTGNYEVVGFAAKWCTILQGLEVVHPLLGFTKGGAIEPFIQITSRYLIIICMVDWVEHMQTEVIVSLCLLVWCTIECIRYPYYITSIVKKPIYILTWLRYTMWMPLYPAGILCEITIVLKNVAYFVETKRWSVSLPNILNGTFYMPYAMIVWAVLLMGPGAFAALTHMAKQRKKFLNKIVCNT